MSPTYLAECKENEDVTEDDLQKAHKLLKKAILEEQLGNELSAFENYVRSTNHFILAETRREETYDPQTARFIISRIRLLRKRLASIDYEASLSADIPTDYLFQIIEQGHYWPEEERPQQEMGNVFEDVKNSSTNYVGKIILSFIIIVIILILFVTIWNLFTYV